MAGGGVGDGLRGVEVGLGCDVGLAIARGGRDRRAGRQAGAAASNRSERDVGDGERPGQGDVARVGKCVGVADRLADAVIGGPARSLGDGQRRRLNADGVHVDRDRGRVDRGGPEARVAGGGVGDGLRGVEVGLGCDVGLAIARGGRDRRAGRQAGAAASNRSERDVGDGERPGQGDVARVGKCVGVADRLADAVIGGPARSLGDGQLWILSHVVSEACGLCHVIRHRRDLLQVVVVDGVHVAADPAERCTRRRLLEDPEAGAAAGEGELRRVERDGHRAVRARYVLGDDAAVLPILEIEGPARGQRATHGVAVIPCDGFSRVAGLLFSGVAAGVVGAPVSVGRHVRVGRADLFVHRDGEGRQSRVKSRRHRLADIAARAAAIEAARELGDRQRDRQHSRRGSGGRADLNEAEVRHAVRGDGNAAARDHRQAGSARNGRHGKSVGDAVRVPHVLDREGRRVAHDDGARRLAGDRHSLDGPGHGNGGHRRDGKEADDYGYGPAPECARTQSLGQHSANSSTNVGDKRARRRATTHDRPPRKACPRTTHLRRLRNR